MKKLTDYIQESRQWMESPGPGDTFGIELEDDTLLETYVLEVADDGSVLLDSTEEIYGLLESWNMLSDDIDTDEHAMEQRDAIDEIAPLAALAGGALAQQAGAGAVGQMAGRMAGHSVGQAVDRKMQSEPVNEFDLENEPQQDPGEYDHEGDMAKNELHTIVRAARKLIGMLDDDDNMPEWTQKKITKATDYVDTAADYISSQKERGVMERFAKDPGKLDLSANPTKSQVWARYMEIYDYEGYQGEENSQEMQDLEDYAAQRFGQDMVNDMMKAGYYSYFGRPDDPKKPIDQGSGNYTSLGRSPVSDKDIKKSGTLNKRATAGTKDRILSRLGKHPKPALPEGQSEETSPVARAVLHRIMMAHPGVLAQHGPERVMSAVDELADRVNIGPDDEIGTSDVSGWVRDVIRMLAELPDEPMSNVDALDEAEYQGRKVELNKPSSNTDGASKSKVYVKDPKTGNVKKVTFGDPNMRIRKSNPGARKNFRARHKCDTAKDKTTARYWSCRAW
jgi:hypothetical protein